jgi:hypothetical protein
MNPSTWGVEKAVPTLITGGFFLHLINFCRTLTFEGASAADIVLWPVDFALFTLMVYSSAALILRRRAFAARFHMEAPWRRVGYWLITAYVTLSLPIHIQFLATGRADMINNAPWWFSGAILPVYVAILAYFFTLRSRADAPRGMATA